MGLFLKRGTPSQEEPQAGPLVQKALLSQEVTAPRVTAPEHLPANRDVVVGDSDADDPDPV